MHSVGCIPRERFERWPRFPGLRTESQYEEFTFTTSLIARRVYHPDNFDAVISCSYPYINWMLQHAGGKKRPKHIFVTQNGDWMCYANSREYRWFRCDGLVCINPTYFERHHSRYESILIPNGVDPEVYHPREAADEGRDPRIPTDARVVLMVSALIPSKGVVEGVRAVSKVPNAFMLVAGDGPERDAVASLAAELLPNRHLLLGSVQREDVPGLYRQANAFLHMSTIEPFGIVYLEAAASGLPVVAPDIEVPRWILGNTAYYSNVAETESVSNALAAALDPGQGVARGDAARRRILEDWTWDMQAAKYREFIERIISGADRPS